MPVIEILNPQDPIPEVMTMYTVLEGVEVKLDLNEDYWATDYFIIFFHTGPNDPVSTSIQRYCYIWFTYDLDAHDALLDVDIDADAGNSDADV